MKKIAASLIEKADIEATKIGCCMPFFVIIFIFYKFGLSKIVF